ncbi:MAG TPA: histidine phosphatase family protein [Fontimonas sp.]
MRLLTLVRHAKSSWDQPGQRDFDRPLNERGERDAPRMAAHVRRMAGTPDAIVSSPALRALTTARVFAEAMDLPAARIVEQPRIYEASAATLLELVRQFDDGLRHIMMFGHNPGFSELAHALAPVSFEDLSTCAAVQIGFDVARWAEIQQGRGAQHFYAYPKQFKQQT